MIRDLYDFFKCFEQIIFLKIEIVAVSIFKNGKQRNSKSKYFSISIIFNMISMRNCIVLHYFVTIRDDNTERLMVQQLFLLFQSLKL